MKTASNRSIHVQNLRCEYERNPLGIDVREPRLSWKLVSEQRGVVQSAYQIRVTNEQGEVVWETGKVLSDQSIHVSYAGPALHSRQCCTWQVRVWDGQDQPSTWSEPAWWEMGLLHATNWQAHWIEPDWNEDPAAFNPCPYLRTAFLIDEPIRSARLYVTAHGLYEAWLNGQHVGDAYFTPGYTNYHHRLQYQTYDVGSPLLPGENAIGVILGDGWYRGSIDVGPRRNVYGQTLGLLLQLQVRYADGREQLITSDEQWRATTGPILKSDLQDGEIYDARLEMPGWNQQGFDASSWQNVRLVNYPLENLVATISPPMRRKERFVPATIFTTPTGETVVDMGQIEEGNVHGSLNHCAYGATGSWLYQVVAGMELGSPGYKHTRFQPQPGGGITAASATYASLYGEIASSWQIEHGQFTLRVTVPANTTATVCIPVCMGRQVTEAGQAPEASRGVIGVKQEPDGTHIEVSSGTYTFTSRLVAATEVT